MANPMEDTTLDKFLGGRLELWQPKAGFRVSVDAVLLAAAAQAKPGQVILDAGCGVGAVSLCLLQRLPGVTAIGLEIEPFYADLARRNAELNPAGENFTVQTGDFFAASPPQPVHHIVSNPPYIPAAAYRPSPHAHKSQAQAESNYTLVEWIGRAAQLLPAKGTFTLVQRADRLDDILLGLKQHGFGNIKILPLWSKPERPAKRILVQATKGSRAALMLMSGLLIHAADNSYTPLVRDIIYEGAAIDWTVDPAAKAG